MDKDLRSLHQDSLDQDSLDQDSLDQQTLDLAEQLIAAESVSPADAGCQTIIADYLRNLGFSIEAMPFGDVDNLWALHRAPAAEVAGAGASAEDSATHADEPLFVFAGHTDVVPPGPLGDWATPPFVPTLKDGMLYGRGAADMKGSLAAMLTATRRFLAGYPQHRGTLGFLITSDEEAAAIHGTREVMATLQQRGTKITWCLVGEPSSQDTLGDVVRSGRRGSLNGHLTVKGIQGHVAYPTEALNPIHAALPALAELIAVTWDNGNEFFPPTSLQISNMHAGTGASNVIPGDLRLLFNFRFSTESDQASLQARTEAILARHGLDYALDWSLSGQPFLTRRGELIPMVQRVIKNRLAIDTQLSTSGGTSDGRFIAPTGTQVVELGPRNATIHKVNECVATADLVALSHLYSDILAGLLGEAQP